MAPDGPPLQLCAPASGWGQGGSRLPAGEWPPPRHPDAAQGVLAVTFKQELPAVLRGARWACLAGRVCACVRACCCWLTLPACCGGFAGPWPARPGGGGAAVRGGAGARGRGHAHGVRQGARQAGPPGRGRPPAQHAPRSARARSSQAHTGSLRAPQACCGHARGSGRLVDKLKIWRILQVPPTPAAPLCPPPPWELLPPTCREGPSYRDRAPLHQTG